MNKTEYEQWLKIKRPAHIDMRPLDGSTRSLLFGIQLGGQNERVHLFQHKDQMHLVRFRAPSPSEYETHGCDTVVTRHLIGPSVSSREFTGNERWRAELCDFNFCKLLDEFCVELHILPHSGTLDLEGLAKEGRLAGYTHVDELEVEHDFKGIVLEAEPYPTE